MDNNNRPPFTVCIHADWYNVICLLDRGLRVAQLCRMRTDTAETGGLGQPYQLFGFLEFFGNAVFILHLNEKVGLS